ncbi:hypothetical protein ElP_61950 [Tautonia plasticadhaerens]|uniref:Uncharacterized protein n=1 Tax=Tautonia plasticadhaerens TaxID=2527974 RepID=A0A518HBK1_9BACT|nr:hypothetical protein ElP_61950 [Tautonia plasticadhaerens]
MIARRRSEDNRRGGRAGPGPPAAVLPAIRHRPPRPPGRNGPRPVVRRFCDWNRPPTRSLWRRADRSVRPSLAARSPSRCRPTRRSPRLPRPSRPSPPPRRSGRPRPAHSPPGTATRRDGREIRARRDGANPFRGRGNAAIPSPFADWVDRARGDLGAPAESRPHPDRVRRPGLGVAPSPRPRRRGAPRPSPINPTPSIARPVRTATERTHFRPGVSIANSFFAWICVGALRTPSRRTGRVPGPPEGPASRLPGRDGRGLGTPGARAGRVRPGAGGVPRRPIGAHRDGANPFSTRIFGRKANRDWKLH